MDKNECEQVLFDYLFTLQSIISNGNINEIEEKAWEEALVKMKSKYNYALDPKLELYKTIFRTGFSEGIAFAVKSLDVAIKKVE